MKKLTYICMAGAAVFALSHSSYARIGEKRSEIEKRMDSRLDGAYQYPQEDAMREALELPYNKILLIQPYGSDNTFYFKRAERSKTEMVDVSNQTDLVGWEIHFAYQDGNSVMEFYRRYGDPMTLEELEGLMTIMLEGKEGVRWTRSEFVPSLERWDVEFNDGVPYAVYYTRDGKKIETGPDANSELKEILPNRAVRNIYIEMQPKFRGASVYNKSVQKLIEEDAQRAAFENYEALIKKRKEYSDSRTKRNEPSRSERGSTQRISKSAQAEKDAYGMANRRNVIPFKGSFLRDIETTAFKLDDHANVGFSVLKYAVPNVFVGDRPKVNRERKIQWDMNIPLQPKTSIGYNYVTNDGKIRALVYENAVLFMDTEYDEGIREYMEELYADQVEIRGQEAKSSLHKF